MDELCEGEKIVRHSTSSVDIASVIYQLKEFWRLLSWPDINTGVHFEAQFIDAACSTAICYSDLVHQQLIDSGYYEQQGSFKVTDEFCVAVNNLEYVRRALSEFHSDELNLNQMQQMLDNTLVQIERTVERIMNRMAITMQSSMQKSVFHLVSCRRETKFGC